MSVWSLKIDDGLKVISNVYKNQFVMVVMKRGLIKDRAVGSNW